MRKITLLTMLCLFSTFLLNAQTEKGKFLLGASSNFYLIGSGGEVMNLGYTTTKFKSDADGYTEPDPDKTFGFNLLPKVGYFVIDNLAIGLDSYISINNTEEGDGTEYNSTTVGFGPFVRYYIPTSSIKPFFEISGSYGLLKSKDKDEISTIEMKFDVYTFTGGAGIAFPLGDKASFDLLVGYNSRTIKDKKNNDDNYRTVSGTIAMKIGFVVLL